jgi:2-dehydropantoate 2-reductase
VESEDAFSRDHGSVIGAVWRETCTRLADNRVRFQIERPGRAVLGRHPRGLEQDPELDALADLLRKGAIDVGLSPCIARDKWLKLCVNLTSAPNALVRQSDHGSPAFVETKVRLLEEARAALRAAGIVASSGDGRDRSLDDEIAHHRSSLERGSSARPIPLYNQVWASLERGAPPEADAYHQRILDLAHAHGLTAPTNARVLEHLKRAFAAGTGPECLAADELLPA